MNLCIFSLLDYNLKVLHHHLLCNWLTYSSSCRVCRCVYDLSPYKMPCAWLESFISYYLKTDNNKKFYISALLFCVVQKYYCDKSCIFFQTVVPYSTKHLEVSAKSHILDSVMIIYHPQPISYRIPWEATILLFYVLQKL